MSKNITPEELSEFTRCIAAGIDKAKNPSAGRVASDINCAIAAMNGDEKAISRVRSVIATMAAKAEPAAKSTQASAPAAPITLAFSGELGPDIMERLAAEVAKRRPEFVGKKLQFSLSAKPADSK